MTLEEYKEQVERDAREAIEEGAGWYGSWDDMYDALFVDDAVTGNGSGCWLRHRAVLRGSGGRGRGGPVPCARARVRSARSGVRGCEGGVGIAVRGAAPRRGGTAAAVAGARRRLLGAGPPSRAQPPLGCDPHGLPRLRRGAPGPDERGPPPGRSRRRLNGSPPLRPPSRCADPKRSPWVAFRNRSAHAARAPRTAAFDGSTVRHHSAVSRVAGSRSRCIRWLNGSPSFRVRSQSHTACPLSGIVVV